MLLLACYLFNLSKNVAHSVTWATVKNNNINSNNNKNMVLLYTGDDAGGREGDGAVDQSPYSHARRFIASVPARLHRSNRHGISFHSPEYAKNSRVSNVTVRSPPSPQFPHGSIDPIGMESVFTLPNMRKIAESTVRSPSPQFPHGSIDPIGMESVFTFPNMRQIAESLM
jgi:hypothetical protein